MSLTTYTRKRDFRSTPEPHSFKSQRKKSRLTFVVQKHDATRLHYDFRLEMEGVLKSWAIPKGPSMIAGEKRLAILVEDHPLQYGKFFGEIPEGNYGAGMVEIWDKGTYTPSIQGDDPEHMLKKGDLKFSLNGKYLKGRFALFHLKNEEKDNEWMLVKKADEYARESFNIELIPPLKSKTQQKGKTKRIDSFPDPLPGPMLAKPVREINDDPSWIYEMKLDGFRTMCSVRDGKVELISRNGNSLTRQFATLLKDLSKIEDQVILDGEVVAEDSEGRDNFQLLQNFSSETKGKLKYYVFDMLYLNGHSIIKFPLIKRKELLDTFFQKYNFERVLKLEYQVGNGKELFRKLSGEGYEGIIAKNPGSIYIPGKRSDSWLKVKSAKTQDAVICGYTMPMGSRKYFGSVILGVYNDGRLNYTGNCGTGFSDESLKDLFRRFESLKTEKSPLSEPPGKTFLKGKPVWIAPKLVARIKFMGWTQGRIMRTPVFLGLRTDIEPGEAIYEIQAENEIPMKHNIGQDSTSDLISKKIKLSNPDKIYWPREGYTKGDLALYYQKISRFILPYLKNRPQSLNRYPNGIEGKSFYHKNMNPDQIPEWAKTVKIKSGTNPEGIDYLICNNVATLIFMVNLGCIEINPWLSTYLNPDYPSYLILDLDPGDINFGEVVNTALVIKELCDEVDIPCYCKTSGATGLHIYIPLGSKYDYDQSKTFAQILAVIVHNRLPSVTSLERSVSKRIGKVYIDYLQNRKGQTVAAPYSVRPRPMATVSAPLDWKEVNSDLRPELFTIKNIEKRLEKTGDLWKPVLKSGISLPKALRKIEKRS